MPTRSKHPPHSPARSAVRPLRGRARGRLPRTNRVLRGLDLAAEPRDPREDLRTDAPSRRAGATGRALLEPGRARAHQRHAPELQRQGTRQLRLEPVRPDPRRSQAARLAGAADGHLARAPLGHLQPESAIRHEARQPGLQGIHDGRGPSLRLGGRHLRDLERAQPPRLPAAAVQLQRLARLAAHLPRPLPGRIPGPAGSRPGPSPGAVRRNRPHWLRLGQEPAADRKIQGPDARRGPARVPARSPVPELPLPQGGRLQRAFDDRLRRPRLHDGGGAELQDTRGRQRHHRGAVAALQRAQHGRGRPTPCRGACRST